MKRDPEIIHKTMSHIRGKNTGIELRVRKELSSRGVKYRLYSSKVFGHPDLVIEKYKIAIFCDSEFWHGYKFEENKEKIHSNLEYWIPKIERNIERDNEVNAKLKEQGYLVLRFWGFEIMKDLDRVIDDIMSAIEKQKMIVGLTEAGKKNKTTLAYIEKDDSYLMLHRTKKKNDPNEGKWVGVGGHVEKGESIHAAMKREIREETGLNVIKFKYMGYVDFLNTQCPSERMYLYKVPQWDGEMIECNEGDLEFVKKEKIASLNLWEGDKTFMPLLDADGKKPFALTLIYDGDELKEVVGPFYKQEKKAKPKKRRRKKNGRNSA